MTDHIPPDVDKASISVDKASITPPPGAEEVSFYREHRYDAPWDVPAPYLDMADAAITELLSWYWGVVRERDELRAEAHLSDRAFDVQKQLTEQAEREREQLRTKFLKCSNSLDETRKLLDYANTELADTVVMWQQAEDAVCIGDGALKEARAAQKKAQRDLDLARGALAAQEERDIAAAESVGEPPFGCDTSQHLADLLADERAEMERLKRVVASMDDDLAARSREWAMEHGEDEDAVWTAVQFIEHYAASTGEGT